MRILLTNDDGFEAPGLAAMRDALLDLGDVTVVAPARVQSATSHAATFHRPIAVDQRAAPFEGFAVDGRPADCVKLGLTVLSDKPFDLVVSGMNAGANVGLNTLYSGTVGAAREAAFAGIPAVATSLHHKAWNHDHWDRAAQHARRAIDAVLAETFEPRTVVNINVPILDDGREPRGVAAAPISLVHVDDSYTHTEPHPDRPSPEQAKHYLAGPAMAYPQREPGTDVGLLYGGYVTVTPLHFDLSHQAELDRLRNRLGNPAPDTVQVP